MKKKYFFSLILLLGVFALSFAVQNLNYSVAHAEIKTSFENKNSISQTLLENSVLSNQELVEISTNMNYQAFAETYQAFVFSVDNPEDKNVEWFLLANTNKYIKQNTTTSTFSFTPLAPGSVSVMAKIEEEYTAVKTVNVGFKPFDSSLKISVKELEVNAHGFPNYEFIINNVDQNNDLQNVKWFIRGYTNPAQYGGKSFVFEPTQYGSYKIRAVYENESLESNEYLLEIKVDRTSDVIKFTAVIVSVMAILLVVLIVREIKRDKIW